MLRGIPSIFATFAAMIALLIGSHFCFAQTETTLYNFQGAPDGSVPSARLIRDSSGNLYGTTADGGAVSYGSGTVFEISATGKLTILYSFAGDFNGAFDGANPMASLIRDSSGNLYGTTVNGGGSKTFGGCGTIFKLSPTGKETVLYRFTCGADGAFPLTALLRDSEGNLYGTTSNYGNTSCVSKLGGGCGTLIRLNTSGHLTVLHTFGSGTDGQSPDADLLTDAAGNFYGSTYSGGTYGYGTVYKLAKNGTYSVLYSFNFGVNNDGALPIGKLVQDSAGSLYGTTLYGGLRQTGSCGYNGCGSIFKIDPSGKETVLYAFTGEPDGSNPRAGLVADSAGNLYGTTDAGGAENQGAVFRVDTSGQESIVHSFSFTDGAQPIAGLTPGLGDVFYGTTSQGGSADAGVLFKLIP
ncbi:MAG TPA: choice-of-anchor tandem repeat GloVer-containing protein [Candidatus Sulfotelmatobacter sp.]